MKELSKEEIPPGGVVTDPSLHKKAVDKVACSFMQEGFCLEQTIPSSVKGAKGNQEFFVLFKRK